MKIAWASNAPWAPTGYGQQTALMLPRLAAAGHDVAAIANYGLYGSILEWEGIRVYPAGSDWSNDTIPAHAYHHFGDEPGLLVVLYDAWTLRNPVYREMNMAVWVPIDHTPAPPMVANHFQEHGSTPIAMSRFGEKQLLDYGLRPLYAPHGIDTKIFHPTPKAEAKKAMGFPADKFLVGMVSTNNSSPIIRKAYPEAMAAYAMFHAANPDSILYIHAHHKARLNGCDLMSLANGRGIPADALLFVDEYRYLAGGISPQEMALLYSAFDVLLFPSLGEGFGIPAMEAQACGTPIIVTDFSAQTELVAPGAGFLVQSQPFWDTAQNADFAMPFIEDIFQALEFAYKNRDALEEAGPKCRAFAETYDADLVFQRDWVPVLDALAGDLPTTEPIAL